MPGTPHEPYETKSTAKRDAEETLAAPLAALRKSVQTQEEISRIAGLTERTPAAAVALGEQVRPKPRLATDDGDPVA